jgi:hypothetical protein
MWSDGIMGLQNLNKKIFNKVGDFHTFSLEIKNLDNLVLIMKNWLDDLKSQVCVFSLRANLMEE